jgi:catechol 2,3-dioxygenase-like lactoylglutathione lyase family enzyme
MQQSDIAIPILPSRSLNDTLTFFRRLGFEGTIHSHGDYAILARGTVELHFFTHTELRPAESSAMCYIRVSDVESIYQAFALAQLPPKGIPRMDAIQDKAWGMREFAIVDPDGNLLRIGQLLRP